MNGVPINKASAREYFVVSEAEADDVADLRNAARLTARVFNQLVAPLMDAEGVRRFWYVAESEAQSDGRIGGAV